MDMENDLFHFHRYVFVVFIFVELSLGKDTPPKKKPTEPNNIREVKVGTKGL